MTVEHKSARRLRRPEPSSFQRGKELGAEPRSVSLKHPSVGVQHIAHDLTGIAASQNSLRWRTLPVMLAGRMFLIAFFAAASASCDTGQPASSASLSHLEPATSELGQRSSVRINGAGFHIPLQSDLATDKVTVDLPTASLGPTALEDLLFRNEELIEAVVPAGLPAGTYSLSLTLGEERIELADAFTVIDLRDGGVSEVDGGVDAGVGRSSDLCRLSPDDCEDGQAGASCSSNFDCQESCCQDSNNCAGGMCSFSCEDDTQCPADMACEHNICFYRCTQDVDCAPGQSCEHDNTLCEWP